MFFIFCWMTLTQLATDAQAWLDQPSKILEERYDDKQMTLKGFAHRDETGKWSLASQPSLRSCCIGDQQLATLQIVLDAELDEQLRFQVATVEGLVKVKPNYDAEGALVGLYYLEGTRIIDNQKKDQKQEKGFWMIFKGVAVLVVGAGTGVGIWRWRRLGS